MNTDSERNMDEKLSNIVVNSLRPSDAYLRR